MFKGFGISPQVQWRPAALQWGHEGAPVQCQVMIAVHVFYRPNGLVIHYNVGNKSVMLKIFSWSGLATYIALFSPYILKVLVILSLAMQKRLKIKLCVSPLPDITGTLVYSSSRYQKRDVSSKSPWRKFWLLWFEPVLKMKMYVPSSGSVTHLHQSCFC